MRFFRRFGLKDSVANLWKEVDYIHKRIEDAASNLRLEREFSNAEYLERIAIALEKHAGIVYGRPTNQEGPETLYCGSCDVFWSPPNTIYEDDGTPICDYCGRPLRVYGGGQPNAIGTDDSHN